MKSCTCRSVGFTAGQAAEAADVPYYQINYLAKTGILEPSVRTAKGSDTCRIYSCGDVIALRAIGILRKTGISQNTLQGFTDYIRTKSCSAISEDMRLFATPDGRVVENRGSKWPRWVRSASDVVIIFNLGTVAKDVAAALSRCEGPTRGKAKKAVELAAP